MRITLEEARQLYTQGEMAKEIALREFTEGEILNDYTKITTLSMAPGEKLYEALTQAYKAISNGRPIMLTKRYSYYPEIIYTFKNCKPRSEEGFRGTIQIDDKEFNIYIRTRQSIWGGRLGFENDGVYCGHVENRWLFRDKEQSDHFIKHFWRELILVELGDFYAINFLGNTAK